MTNQSDKFVVSKGIGITTLLFDLYNGLYCQMDRQTQTQDVLHTIIISMCRFLLVYASGGFSSEEREEDPP